ncbi:MAG: SdrD B-like domain-containing protein [Planctomycetaceae bacterium]
MQQVPAAPPSSAATGIWTIGNLAQGTSETLTLTITVGATAAGGTTTNTVQVTSLAETDSNPANNTDSEDTTVVQSVDIGLTKTDNNDPVTAGSGNGNLTYTVTAHNNGPSAATGVTVTDAMIAALPTGWTLVSAVGSNGTTFNGTTGVWTIGNLANGASETLAITITVGSSAAAGTRTNTVSVSGLNEVDNNAANDTATEDTTVVRSVDVSVVKSDSADPITAGSGNGNLTYTVVATNNGPSDASGVAITDALITALPTGWSLVSATGTGATTFNSTTGVWTIGNLAQGASRSLSVVITVGASAASGTTTNTATVSAVTETDSNPANNTDSEDTTIQRVVDIVVAKADSDDPVIPGSGAGNLSYTITATNNGPSDATGVQVTDAFLTALPAGFSFVSASGDGTFNSTTGIWNIGNLASGASVAMTAVLTVGATAASGTVTNTVIVSAVNETDSNPGNNTDTEDTTLTRTVDISVLKADSDDPITAGSGAGNLVYTVTARNNGPSQATGVAVTDAFLTALPAGFSLVSAVGTSGTTFNSSTGVWTIGSLSVGASQTLTVTLTVGAAAAAGTVTNTATVSAVNETDSNLNNNTDTEDTTILRSVDIAVVKSDNANVITAGSGTGNLIYTITATNNGPSDASGVAVTDAFLAALPTGFSLVSASGTGGSTFVAGTGIWTIGNLAVGQSRTLTATLTVGVTAANGTITNTAVVSAVNETDSNLTNNSDSEDTTIVREVDIAVTKSDANDPVVAGSGTGNLVYTLTATNNGPSDATGVTVTDALLTALPSGITFSSVNAGGGTTFNSSNGVWTVGSLAAGSSQNLTVTLTVGASAAAGRIVNIATVSHVNETDIDPTNDTATETTDIARHVDLQVTKSDAVDPIRSPGQITYTIVVRNNGPSTATGVVMTDTLSSLVDFASASSTQGSTVEGGGVVTSQLGTLQPGSSATVTLTVDADVPLGATVHNIASVTATETDTNPANNTDDEDTDVLPAFASVRGVVYQDLNDNGIQDSNEQPIAGTIVGLSGIDSNGDPVLRTIVTGADGAYAFEELLQGEYSLFEIQPGIYLDGTDTVGSGASATALNDAFVNLNLTAGANATAFNFGEGIQSESKRNFLASSQKVDQLLFAVQPVTGNSSLAGRVAVDTNRNGVLDTGELGIPGATVILAGTDSSGNTVLIYRTTAADGTYRFANLAPGQYSIVGAQPPAYADGVEVVGNLMPGELLNDVFASIALPANTNGSGFLFLEQPRSTGTVVNANVVPVLAAQSVERGSNPTISWAPVTGADHYDVWVSQISGGYRTVYRNDDVSGTSLQIPVDLALGQHRMWVRAVNASGVKGPWSPQADFVVSASPNILSPVVSTVDRTPTVQWTAVSGATAYDLLLQDSSGAELQKIENLRTTSHTLNTGLTEGAYRVWVRARNSAYTGDWSTASEFRVTGAPAVLSPVTASVLAAPMIEWTDIGAEQYEIWMNDASGQPMGVETVSGTSMLVNHQLAAGNYKVWVRGLDGDGNRTAWSSAKSFTVGSSTQVLSPTANVNTHNPSFTWAAVPGATHYDLWVSNTSGQFARAQNVVGTSHSFSQTFPDGDYRVWVKPIGVSGAGTWSKAATFSIGGLAAPRLTSPAATTSDRTPTITWNAVTGATGYELWVNHVGITSKVIHETSLTTNSFTPGTNLAAGSYRVWVRAINSAGTLGAWSPALNFELT